MPSGGGCGPRRDDFFPGTSCGLSPLRGFGLTACGTGLRDGQPCCPRVNRRVAWSAIRLQPLCVPSQPDDGWSECQRALTAITGAVWTVTEAGASCGAGRIRRARAAAFDLFGAVHGIVGAADLQQRVSPAVTASRSLCKHRGTRLRGRPWDGPQDYASHGRPRPRRATAAWPHACGERNIRPLAPRIPEGTGWVPRPERRLLDRSFTCPHDSTTVPAPRIAVFRA